MTKDNEIREMHMISHPIRRSMIQTIINSGNKGCYPTKIAKEIKRDRGLISFHLLKLENAGMLEGKYGLKRLENDQPRSVRYYKLTRKGKKIFEKLNKI